MAFTIASVICSPECTKISLFKGLITSCNATRPKILSPKVSTISSFFFKAETSIPLNVPQSTEFTITS